MKKVQAILMLLVLCIGGCAWPWHGIFKTTPETRTGSTSHAESTQPVRTTKKTYTIIIRKATTRPIVEEVPRENP